MELAYDELHEIAQYHLELGSRDEVLDTTILVHEAYLRLALVEDWEGRGRARLFASCSRRRAGVHAGAEVGLRRPRPSRE